MIKKKSTLPFFRYQNKNKVKIETEEENKLLPNIPTDNITEQNDLIHARAKLIIDKIDVPLRNPNRNTKFPIWKTPG